MLVMCKVYQTMGVNRCRGVLSGSPVHRKKKKAEQREKKKLEKINFRQFSISESWPEGS